MTTRLANERRGGEVPAHVAYSRPTVGRDHCERCGPGGRKGRAKGRCIPAKYARPGTSHFFFDHNSQEYVMSHDEQCWHVYISRSAGKKHARALCATKEDCRSPHRSYINNTSRANCAEASYPESLTLSHCADSNKRFSWPRMRSASSRRRPMSTPAAALAPFFPAAPTPAAPESSPNDPQPYLDPLPAARAVLSLACFLL